MVCVRDMIREKLRADGFDGLATEDCGCGVDDLMPCCGNWGDPSDCVPARAQIATEPGDFYEAGDLIWVAV